MAKQESKNTAPEEQPVKKPLMAKLLVGGFVSFVLLAETAIFFLMVPSADEVAVLAEAKILEQVEAKMEADGEQTVEDENDLIDFPLGEYGVTFIPPGADREYRVEFQLYGSIHAKDEKKLQEIYSKKKATFQHRIMLEIRNATVDELMENQLGLIQRRLLATSNEVLSEGEPIILGVSLPGYLVMED
ncbi:MAG: dihydrolipoamide acetyltransferase [Planctomycetota bacterium]|nr:MAG: dihydrolipoamide acetyltransferase [Planctomycetota bacterium]